MTKKLNKTQTTGVAIIGNDTALVSTKLAQIATKMSKLVDIATTTWKTNGALTSVSGLRNIKDAETDISNLIKANSSVREKKKAYDESAKDLGLTTYPVFKIDGYTHEEWRHDILLKLQIVGQDETRKKLEAAKDKLSKFMSEEEQRSLAFKEVESLLENI